jgi:hypothetical protein
VLARATAESERTGRSLASTLRAAPELDLTGPELDALLDPLHYLGVAAHLVDRSVARHRDA